MIGQRLRDRYRIEAEIGAGGMSTVYRAHDEVLERRVAIKLMRRDVVNDDQQLERFKREARAAAKLSHPHIVTVVDAGDQDGRPFIVFEFVDGETLKQRIRRLGRLSIDESVAYAIEIAQALSAAHVAQVVHRDIKPQNVLLDSEGHAKVGDFGIARQLEVDGLTKTGRVVGTTDYVSPEQALGDEVTGQSDIYSLGIVLFEMLTGEVPFKGDNHVAVAMKHVKEGLPNIQARRPQVSAALASVLEKMTAKELGNRYSSAAQVIRELEDVFAFEVARAGQSTGEATALLDVLPRQSRRFIPKRVRAPESVLMRRLAAGLLIAGAVALVVTNLEQGTGDSPRLNRSVGGKVVPLTGAGVFDPPPGDRAEHSDRAGAVLDSNPGTTWSTERYNNARFPTGKSGVGIYVRTRAPATPRAIEIQTPNPDMAVQIYGATQIPDDLSGWTLLGSADGSIDGQTIELASPTAIPMRNFMVWITRLPPRGHAAISEIQLRR